MKQSYISSTTFCIILLLAFNTIKAQSLQGPSDTKTAPPSNSQSIGKIICAGQVISITGPQDANNSDFAIYHWYKLDASGNKQLTATTGKIFTETSTASGYYNYQLVTENANGCTSPLSDEFQVFAVPLPTAAISATNTAVCKTIGTTTLTANTTANTGYSYYYQWTRNGIDISGANANTYTITGEDSNAPLVFGVNISYSLNTKISATATQNITITPTATKPLITAN